ncbi:hypothetical protein [Natrarchaeobaculum aegyptiacum]|uniref:Uncharacterized protein n=1 Tax=Natrarchaeobaculum aegyptiacum TaxID=745377 RepID=A0A2Z2HP46_9EURY|nr:hypothetical protein [Natrarchaeobaculum aegyptiacum]ARS88769.1 hypothetical protein B1756_02680 [Natrarchaeobaculum aegyptiacum]
MYEATFGTDWERIDDRDEVVFRAYAIGVATRLGEPQPDELEALLTQVESAYDRSFVLLAFRKGRDEAAAADTDDDETIWEQLVEAKSGIDPLEWEEMTEAEWNEPDPLQDTTIPDALDRFDVDFLPADSTAAVRRPSFLERESGASPFGDSERSVFGRPVDDLADGTSTSNDTASGHDVADPDAADARNGVDGASPPDSDGATGSSSGARPDASDGSDPGATNGSNADARSRNGGRDSEGSSDS